MNASHEPPQIPLPSAHGVLGDYWSFLRSYRWLILGVTVLTVSVVLAWSFRQPRVYSATCSVEYDPNPVTPLGGDLQDGSGQSSAFWMSREFFETQNRIIASRQVAERVVRRLGLNGSPTAAGAPAARTVEEAAVELQEHVSVELLRGTRLVLITVRDGDPDRAALIANTIADVYVEKTIEDRLESTARALEWLSRQLDNLRGELEASELALHAFKEAHHILSVSLEDRQNLIAQDIQRFSEALANARTRRIETRARLGRTRGLLEGTQVEDRAAALGDVATIAQLRGQIITKIAEHDRLAIRYGDAHPSMREVTSEIDVLRRQLEVELDAVVRAADGNVREVEQIETGIRQALEDAHNAGLDLNLREIEYGRLVRQRENNSKVYQVVLERTTETDLTHMLRTTHVRVVDPALRPITHVSPRMGVNGSVGLALGAILGIALATVLGRMDRRLRTVREVEDLGVSVLGIIPTIGDDEGSRGPTHGKKRPRNETPQDAESRPLIVHTNPMSSVAEHCRIIRTNLMFMAASRPLRTIVVCSPEPREGKTTVTTNLSIALAQSGKRVLMVDTDLRRPRLHYAFKLSSRVGVSNYLLGSHALEDVVLGTEVPNLHVLPSGPVPPNPSELLHVERFAELIRTARATYDFVIFDSPPLGIVTDAAVIASQVDGMILVVKSGHTTRDALAGVLRRVNAVGARVIGSILNDVDRRAGTSDGGGNYYYQGGYYSDASGNEEPPPAELQQPNG